MSAKQLLEAHRQLAVAMDERSTALHGMHLGARAPASTAAGASELIDATLRLQWSRLETTLAHLSQMHADPMSHARPRQCAPSKPAASEATDVPFRDVSST